MRLERIIKSYQHIIIWVTLIFIGIGLFLLLVSNVYTETFEIERFSQAQETIQSPITIEDTKETERLQREAVQAVGDRYEVLHSITSEQLALIEDIFEAIEVVNKPVIVENEQPDDADTTNNSDSEDEPTTKLAEVERTIPEKLQLLKEMLGEDVYQSLSQEEWEIVMSMSTAQKNSSYTLLVSALNEAFNEGITRDELPEKKQSLTDRLRYSMLPEDIVATLSTLGQALLVENSFFSIEKTMTAEEQALNNVEPQMIRAGEVIVREGQTISNDIYETLSLVGLLDQGRNFYPLIGLGFFVVLLVSILGYGFYFDVDLTRDRGKHAFALLILTLVPLIIMKFMSLIEVEATSLYLLMPIASVSMLIRLLFKEKLAILYALFFSLAATVLFNQAIPGALNLQAGVYILFSQLGTIFVLRKVTERFTILKVVLVNSLVNSIVILSFLLIAYESYTWTFIMMQVGFGIIQAIISGVVVVGTLPFFESILSILSDTKLIRLANPNHPLLKKILTEAPGTYHHSLMVANLSEAACEAIGANGLFARVASYFHDIGKTAHPHYFIENQMGIQNPHDFLSPIQSATIILSHTLDGARILKANKFPQEIIDVAKQHHGTTLVKYFYYQAKESLPDVEEEKFRYPGPKPQTKENAVISICDSVEAAVRSMKEPTKEKIDNLIQAIINDRMQDGQFDDCHLTFLDLRKISYTLSETLNGIYHSRIEYPDEKKG
ncbi:HD family phosphohydrolase [Halolactibacillus halophilus]|nr:HDIG domain-containing metalloprotein [Halolactibacillus halophilus]